MKLCNTLPAWIRLQASDPMALKALCRLHNIDFFSRETSRLETTLRIRSVRLQNNQVLVSDIIWHLGDDEQSLYTVETGQRMLCPRLAYERIQAQGLPSDSSQSLTLVLLHQMLGQAKAVLDRIDEGLTVSMQLLREFQFNVGTDRTRGAEDLTDMDNKLSTFNIPLTFVLQSLDDLANAALRFRRISERNLSQPSIHFNELVAEIEGVQRRARFTLERQRFQRNAAGDTVAMSDLNVTKVFSVLWAAFIPGTALINWYGQNFHIMPELSWDGSLWTQLFAVLVLTAIPILMVKQSGALR